MPDNSAKRMVYGPSNIPQFYPAEWIDLPQSILYRYPDLKAWTEAMKQRWETMQGALAERDRTSEIT